VASGEQSLREIEDLLTRLGAIDPQAAPGSRNEDLRGIVPGGNRRTPGVLHPNRCTPLGIRSTVAAECHGA
jgi:hypothetical protein